MSTILGMICPDFPSDRAVVETMASERWYRTVDHTLYVPHEKYLRAHPREVDNYCAAVVGFSRMDLRVLDLGKERWNIPFRVYTDEEGILEYFEDLIANYTGVLTCDIECSDTRWDDQNIIDISIKREDRQEVAIVAPNGYNWTSRVVNAMNRLGAVPADRIQFCWHNGKFDIGRLRYTLGVKLRVDEDTMLLHYVGINERKGTHGLKVLAPLYLQAPQWDDELDDFKAKTARRMGLKIKAFKYDYIPHDILFPYAAMDAEATYELLLLFRKIARPEAMRVYRNLIAASNVYTYVESNGFMVDEDYLNVLHIKLQSDADDAEDVVDAAARKYWDPMAYSRDTGAKYPGKHFNHKSPAQLKWLLQKVTGESIADTTSDTLEDLYRAYPTQDFLQALQNLRRVYKMLDTYVFGIREAMCKDKRVRATFNLHGTETGRLSCSDPNMQNIPRDKTIKNIFKAAPGKVLVNLDYSQAELRSLAYLSQDPWLTQVFIDDLDLHSKVATEMFGPDFTKEQRVQAKTINFGIAYGRGAGSLMDEFGISMSEAQSIINKWYQPMPYVKDYIKTTRAKPMRGEDCVSPMGRMRHFIITNQNRNAIQNESINFPISSTATDLTMLSLIEIQQLIWSVGLTERIKIINNVHDSIVFECDDDPQLVMWLVYQGTKIMHDQPDKQLADCKVPFRADPEVGYSYGKMGELEDYLKSKGIALTLEDIKKNPPVCPNMFVVAETT